MWALAGMNAIGLSCEGHTQGKCCVRVLLAWFDGVVFARAVVDSYCLVETPRRWLREHTPFVLDCIKVLCSAVSLSSSLRAPTVYAWKCKRGCYIPGDNMRHAKDEQFTQTIQLKSNTRITKERVGQELEL